MHDHPTARVRIRAALHRQAKIAAAVQGVSLEEWLNEAIERALAAPAAAAREAEAADSCPD